MDSQYAPGVVDGEKLQLSNDLVARIARAAEDAGVNVFRRFDLMRHWVVQDGLSIGDLVREGDELKLHHERLGDRLRHDGRCSSRSEGAAAAEGAT